MERTKNLISGCLFVVFVTSTICSGSAAGKSTEIRPMVAQTKPPSPTPEKMVWIPGGTFLMGCRDCGLFDSEPVQWVSLKGYWMDETPVTNKDFEAFVARSHHKTTAEQIPRAEDYPDVPPEVLVSGSAVFSPPAEPSSLSNPYAWLCYVPGASWSSPDGKTPLSPSLALHTVVHVSFHDAGSNCQAMGKTLPTEAEYEFAARGGLHAKKYAWGDKLKKTGNGPPISGKDLFLWAPDSSSDNSGFRCVKRPMEKQHRVV